jgi:hypothetical protein
VGNNLLPISEQSLLSTISLHVKLDIEKQLLLFLSVIKIQAQGSSSLINAFNKQLVSISISLQYEGRLQ